MHDLIGRYHDAVERYLRLKLRDKHLADEVLQEFWTKLLTHKLAGADSPRVGSATTSAPSSIA